MSQDKPYFGELERDLAELAEPVAPSPELKANIMAAIGSGEYSQLAPGADDGAKATVSGNVVPLRQEQTASEDATGGIRRGFGRAAVAAAAAIVLIAGVGIVGTTGGPRGGNNGGSTVSENAKGVPSEDGSGVPDEKFMQGAAAENHMHSIMAMGDVRSVSLQADGSTLDVVVSAEMDSGGAMVNGAPVLKRGMGAQVWSIDKAGNARSAGVIGQDPHDNVWMPLPADTMAVRVTEEPLGGSHAPRGTVLAEERL